VGGKLRGGKNPLSKAGFLKYTIGNQRTASSGGDGKGKDMAEESGVYVNAEEGMKRVMNNVKLYVKLLNKFKTDTNLEKLFDALDTRDYEKAQGEAHTIKGVAANLSLPELFKGALEVETQIKAHAVDSGAPESLRACFAATLADIDKVIARYG
jgi:HPt (histidine-containing phosphotransfer) domain-containing protein